MRKIKVGNDTQNVYFTADTHFHHTNIIKYCFRPFKTSLEMDETMIANWNYVVGPNDIVFHLGDFVFHKSYSAQKQMDETSRLLNQLNGKKHLIIGNHDGRGTRRCSDWESVDDILQVKCFGEQSIILCHYAMLVWNKSHHGSSLLHGHSHGTLGTKLDVHNFGKEFSIVYQILSLADVGVDSWGFSPVSYKVIKSFLDYKRTLASTCINKDGQADAKGLINDLDNKRKELVKKELSS